MAESLAVARSEFILGGHKSGKSRRAERLAEQWLAQSGAHRAVLVATARPGDEEMRERIRRHQQDRAARLPNIDTVEEPLQLAQALAQRSMANTLIVVDCLTLWLTNLLMPVPDLALEAPTTQAAQAQVALLLSAIASAAGPVVLVGNEIGLGVIPIGRETRAFVDTLGLLNQQLAAVCERVTWMAAGLSLTLKAPL